MKNLEKVTHFQAKNPELSVKPENVMVKLTGEARK
jgi:hypothetical protein